MQAWLTINYGSRMKAPALAQGAGLGRQLSGAHPAGQMQTVGSATTTARLQDARHRPPQRKTSCLRVPSLITWPPGHLGVAPVMAHLMHCSTYSCMASSAAPICPYCTRTAGRPCAS